MSKFFKMMDNYLVIHSIGEIKDNSLLVPQTGSYEQRRQWADNINKVYALADNITCLKEGDKILLTPHAKLRKIEEVTKIMEKKLGVKMTVEIKDKEGKSIVAKEEKEKYFIVHIDDILCVVNN